MVSLELISRHPDGAPLGPPLLFVHGAFCHAGIWDVNFLPYFAALGYEAHAVSLRGHGNSEGWMQLPWHSLTDYVTDVTECARQFDRPPVLIGHSMGGMIVQRYLRQEPVHAAVLMASVPPYGMWDATVGIAFRDPLLVHQLGLMMTFGPGVIDIATIRRAMVSDRIPDEEIQAYASLFQCESQRVVMEMLAFDPFAWVPEASVPVMVMGAGKDAFFNPAQVEATARAFGIRALMFPEMAHGMMIEPDWKLAADAIVDWLKTL